MVLAEQTDMQALSRRSTRAGVGFVMKLFGTSLLAVLAGFTTHALLLVRDFHLLFVPNYHLACRELFLGHGYWNHIELYGTFPAMALAAFAPFRDTGYLAQEISSVFNEQHRADVVRGWPLDMAAITIVGYALRNTLVLTMATVALTLAAWGFARRARMPYARLALAAAVVPEAIRSTARWTIAIYPGAIACWSLLFQLWLFVGKNVQPRGWPSYDLVFPWRHFWPWICFDPGAAGLVLTGMGLLIFAAAVRAVERSVLAQLNRDAVDLHCHRCGFNLRGRRDGERCSECGEPVDTRRRPTLGLRWLRPRNIAALGILLLFTPLLYPVIGAVIRLVPWWFHGRLSEIL